MAKMNSIVRHSVDKAAQITLRPEGSAALTAAATVNETAVSLDELTAYWAADVVPHQQFAVFVFVNELNTAGDGAYSFKIETGEDAAVTTPVAHLDLDVTAGGTGAYVFHFDVATLKKLDADASHLRIASVITGTTNLNLDFYAFMVPVL